MRAKDGREAIFITMAVMMNTNLRRLMRHVCEWSKVMRMKQMGREIRFNGQRVRMIAGGGWGGPVGWQRARDESQADTKRRRKRESGKRLHQSCSQWEGEEEDEDEDEGGGWSGEWGVGSGELEARRWGWQRWRGRGRGSASLPLYLSTCIISVCTSNAYVLVLMTRTCDLIRHSASMDVSSGACGCEVWINERIRGVFLKWILESFPFRYDKLIFQTPSDFDSFHISFLCSQSDCFVFHLSSVHKISLFSSDRRRRNVSRCLLFTCKLQLAF